MDSDYNQTKKTAILSSISQYKDKIYKDLNLSLRINYEDVTYSTRIIQWENDTIIFDAPLVKRDWFIFPIPCTIEVTFLTQSALYTTLLEVVHKDRKYDGLHYTAHICSPLQRKQQRSHFRLPILLPFTYQIISINALGIEKDDTIYSATTVNLSAGGLRMTSKEKLTHGTYIAIEMTFLDKPLALSGIVLLDGEELENKLYSHRIKFNNLDRQTEHILNKLIFKKQRLMLSRS